MVSGVFFQEKTSTTPILPNQLTKPAGTELRILRFNIGRINRDQSNRTKTVILIVLCLHLTTVFAQGIPWISSATLERIDYLKPPNLQVGYSNWTPVSQDSFSWFPSIPLECWEKKSRLDRQSALFVGFDVLDEPLEKDRFHLIITDLFSNTQVAVVEKRDIIFQKQFTAWSVVLLGSDGTGTFAVGGDIPTKTYIFAMPLPEDIQSRYFPVLLVVLCAQVNDFSGLKDETEEFINNIKIKTSIEPVPEMHRIESRFAEPLLLAKPEQIRKMADMPRMKHY